MNTKKLIQNVTVKIIMEAASASATDLYANNCRAINGIPKRIDEIIANNL